VTRRWVVRYLAVVGVALLAGTWWGPLQAGGQPSTTSSWSTGYYWGSGSPYCYEGWVEEPLASDPGAYSFARGRPGAPGLWIWPTGQRHYDPGSAGWLLRAPDAARIRSARAVVSYDPSAIPNHCLKLELQAESPVPDGELPPDEDLDEDEGEPPDTEEPVGDDSDPPAEGPIVDSFSACRQPGGRRDVTVDLTDASAGGPVSKRLVLRLELPCSHANPSECRKTVGPFDPARGVQLKSVAVTLTDADAPVVGEVGGELRDLAGRYVSRGAYGLSLWAADGSSGVVRVGVAREQGEVQGPLRHDPLSTTTGCNTYHQRIDLGLRTCPGVWGEGLTVQIGDLPEGKTTLRPFAVDQASHVTGADDSWSFYVDRTPPSPPTGLEARYEQDIDAAGFHWVRGADPGLPDGNPGSGVGYELYRWRRPAGVWTAWAKPGDGEPTAAAGLRTGEVVELEVRSVDRVGNQTASSAATLVVLPDDGRDKTNDIGYASFEEPEIFGTNGFGSASVEKAVDGATTMQIGRRRCAFTGRGPDLEAREGEDDVQIAGWGSVGCPVSDPRFQKMEIEVCIQVRDGDDWNPFDCADGEQSTPQPPLRRDVDRRCLAGDHRYRVHIDIKIRLAGTNDIDADEDINERELGCNEAGAWRLRAAAVSNGSRALGQDLARVSDPRPARGFEAHHIIAARETGGPEEAGARSQAYGYACALFPHEYVNGVWLRGPNLKAGTPGYAALPRRLRRRAYHRTIHTTTYFEYIANVLDDGIGPNLTCNRGSVRASLIFLKQRLERNQVPH
jgi:hypothetical protein